MAANIFGRYVWLIDILRRYKRLTFQEISSLWQNSGLSYGEKLPLRTFHNHQKAIKDIFDVYIECDKKNPYTIFRQITNQPAQ
ncbi:putative transcriptional regulator [Prevotella sp. CAG:1185]|nr:putative transcriptional regulator [Prevotella sp. CAG:1185]